MEVVLQHLSDGRVLDRCENLEAVLDFEGGLEVEGSCCHLLVAVHQFSDHLSSVLVLGGAAIHHGVYFGKLHDRTHEGHQLVQLAEEFGLLKAHRVELLDLSVAAEREAELGHL